MYNLVTQGEVSFFDEVKVSSSLADCSTLRALYVFATTAVVLTNSCARLVVATTTNLASAPNISDFDEFSLFGRPYRGNKEPSPRKNGFRKQRKPVLFIGSWDPVGFS
jgi:hypothetical protein